MMIFTLQLSDKVYEEADMEREFWSLNAIINTTNVKTALEIFLQTSNVGLEIRLHIDVFYYLQTSKSGMEIRLYINVFCYLGRFKPVLGPESSWRE
jgi:hypothetical protein